MSRNRSLIEEALKADAARRAAHQRKMHLGRTEPLAKPDPLNSLFPCMWTKFADKWAIKTPFFYEEGAIVNVVAKNGEVSCQKLGRLLLYEECRLHLYDQVGHSFKIFQPCNQKNAP